MTIHKVKYFFKWGFPDGSDGRVSACNAGDPGSIPGLRRSSGEGNGYPLQYSCLKNSIHRGVWQATVRGVAKSDTNERRTLSLIHKINNQKDLLYSTGNSTQYSAIT